MSLSRSTSSDRVAQAPRQAVFLDKDGTLVEDVPFNVDPALLRFTPQALTALQQLSAAGYLLILVTNQSGLATGRFSNGQFSMLRTALLDKLRDEGGIELDGVYVCPHAPGPEGMPVCGCRKPAPGMLQLAALAHNVDLKRSWMIGDILDDVEAGRRAGCRSILLDRGNETVWRVSALRTPHYACTDLLEAAGRILAHEREAEQSEPMAFDVLGAPGRAAMELR